MSGSGQDPTGNAKVSLRVTSSELFQGKRQVVIVHGDQEYRLSITKAHKLILTK